MLPVGWLLVALGVALLLSLWIGFTVTRLDRLHARVDAAWAALEAQLARRTVALRAALDTSASDLEPVVRDRYCRLTERTRDLRDEPDRPLRPADGREAAENDVGRAVVQLVDNAEAIGLPAGLVEELCEAAARVEVARRFYNDAVRDTRLLRAGKMPRLLHLAGHAPMPGFFDIDDRLPAPVRRVPVGSSAGA